MKSSVKNIKLASVDDLFSTEESRADADRERVVEVPLSELHPFEGHPFKVTASVNMVCLFLRLPVLILMVDMKLLPVIADTEPANLQAKKPCRLSSVIWTMMPP